MPNESDPQVTSSNEESRTTSEDTNARDAERHQSPSFPDRYGWGAGRCRARYCRPGCEHGIGEDDRAG